MLKKIKIDPLPMRFVRKELASGSRLANFLLTRSLEKGTIWTYLPPKIEATSLKDFSQSLYLACGIRIDDPSQVIVDWIKEYLEQSLEHRVILDAFDRLGDPIEKSKHIPYIACGSEIYYWLDPSVDLNTILKALKFSHSYPKIIVLTSCHTELATYDHIQDNILREMAISTKYICIGAFDEESYIIWKKNN